MGENNMLTQELQPSDSRGSLDGNKEDHSLQNSVSFSRNGSSDVMPKRCTVVGVGIKTLLPKIGGLCETNGASMSKTSDGIKLRMKFSGLPSSSDDSGVKRMQEITRILALVAFLPGLVLLAAAPCMVIPIFVFPSGNTSLLTTLMLAELCVSVALISIGIAVTNLHWYYDHETERLRCTMNCGEKFRFWGRPNFSYYSLNETYGE